MDSFIIPSIPSGYALAEQNLPINERNPKKRWFCQKYLVVIVGSQHCYSHISIIKMIYSLADFKLKIPTKLCLINISFSKTLKCCI